MSTSEWRLLVREMTELLDRFDLMALEPGTPGGTPAGEYEAEARAVAAFLAQQGSIDLIELSSIWEEWFEVGLLGLAPDHSDELLRAVNALAPARTSGS